MSLGLTGCLTIGVKVRKEIVYSSIAKHVEEGKGLMRIATNEEIPVHVDGTDIGVVEKDVGGYYLLHARDLRLVHRKLSNAVE